MVLKAVGLLLSILYLSFVHLFFFFFFVSIRIPCYSLKCTITLFWNTGSCSNFRVKHGTKFWFAGSAFSVPSQHRNWRIPFFPQFETRSKQKNENTRSHQNRSNCIVCFFLPFTNDCKFSHQIALRLLLSSTLPSAPPPPKAGWLPQFSEQ